MHYSLYTIVYTLFCLENRTVSAILAPWPLILTTLAWSPKRINTKHIDTDSAGHSELLSKFVPESDSAVEVSKTGTGIEFSRCRALLWRLLRRLINAKNVKSRRKVVAL